MRFFWLNNYLAPSKFQCQMLLTFIALYLLATIAIGFWAARRVKNTSDFALAGRKLPLFLAGSALFATWFGSETVMGAPSIFVEEGMLGIMEDPFGAALCLFLAGLLVAKPLYKLNILTFNDYYRLRYNKLTELVSAIFMVPSYFGWIAAQMVAMAILLNVLAGIPVAWGIISCMVIVVIYTTVGGMWAVSITDFVQTVMIVIGVVALAVTVGGQAGGFKKVIVAQPDGFFQFFPDRNMHDWIHYFAAWITIGLGSIPQQDVFQRVMAAKDEKTAVRSSYLAGFMYLTIGFIPLFIGLCAKQLHPELMVDDPQKLLPAMVMQYGGISLQIVFFGAILSAILSTTSGAVLAPATVVAENLIKPLFKKRALTDSELLRIMRISVVGVAIASAIMALKGSSIYELVGLSSALSLVSLFVPLMAGLYWKKANSAGALCAMGFGMATWIWFDLIAPSELPALIYGLGASIVGMVVGSLALEDKG